MASGTALLILDMQNDIMSFHGGDEHIKHVVHTIADLAGWARRSSIPVIYSRVAYRSSYVDGLPGMPILKERHLLDERRPGSAIIDELKPADDDVVITRKRSGGFYNNELEVILRSLRVETLLFTGMSTARVVESTVREAHCRDFRNVVVSDGCAATSMELHDNALRSMADFFATIMTSAEVKKAFA